MQDIKSKIAEIKALVEKRVLHPYLLKYIEVPVIDEDKLLLLVSALEGLDLTEDERNNYALTTMLIQIALDTHEHVSNKQQGSDIKQRQVAVLAGDYYSGLYYKLLAESDDIMMIRALSRGVKEVNEHKIRLYQKDFDNIHQLLESVRNIEAALLSWFSEFFEPGHFSPIIETLLLIKRLLKERSDYLKTGISPFFDALSLIAKKELSGNEGQHLVARLDSELGRLKLELETKTRELANINLVLKHRAEQLAREINENKICVEEG